MTVVVDCEGCVAPCCQNFAVWNAVTLVETDEHYLRQVWTAHAGAILRPVGFTAGGYRRYDCQALEGGRCTVYEDRPETCRRYDCREDTTYTEGPRCAWPR